MQPNNDDQKQYNTYAMATQYSQNIVHNANQKSKNNVDNDQFHSVDKQSKQSDRYQADSLEDQYSFKVRKTHDSEMLRHKYSSISSQLHKISQIEAIDILLEEIEDNRLNKKIINKLQLKIQSANEQLTVLKEALQAKRTTISMLCETQSKNLNIIQKLHIEKIYNNEMIQQSHFERKYRELSKYMNQYIQSNKQAQEQILLAYELSKQQSLRVNLDLQKLQDEQHQLQKRCQLLMRQLQFGYKRQNEVQRQAETQRKELQLCLQQNEQLKQQLQLSLNNLRMSDRFQMQLTQQNDQLSSELDFIRQKVSENENISKHIIAKFESSNGHQKELFNDYARRQEQYVMLRDEINQHQEQNKLLYIQNTKLKQKIQNYELKVHQLQIKNQQLQGNTEELITAYEGQCEQNQKIRQELVELAEKVKFMENSYEKELEQSQKIKCQLKKFWQQKARITNNILQERVNLGKNLKNKGKEIYKDQTQYIKFDANLEDKTRTAHSILNELKYPQEYHILSQKDSNIRHSQSTQSNSKVQRKQYHRKSKQNALQF